MFETFAACAQVERRRSATRTAIASTPGFTAYTVLKIARGEFRTINWLVYVLTALFVVRFFYLAAER